MKKKILVVFAVLLALLNVGVFAQEKKVIVVATFDVGGNAVTQAEAASITERFIAGLSATGKISAVNRASVDKIVRDMKFQPTDWKNRKKTAALGAETNVKLVCHGKIVKFEGGLYITTFVINAKTAKEVYSVRKLFNSLGDISANMGDFAKKMAAGLSIGDTGAGGGTIFYVKNGKTYEVSRILGEEKWKNAVELCKNFRGGGYNDWRLPTRDELHLIYLNLRKTEKVVWNDSYWSSSKAGDDKVWGQNFDSGQFYSDDQSINYVRAIRVY